MDSGRWVLLASSAMAVLIWILWPRRRTYSYEDVRYDVLPLSPNPGFDLRQPYRVDRSDGNPDRLRALLTAQLHENLRQLPTGLMAIDGTEVISIGQPVRDDRGRKVYHGTITVRLRARRGTP